MRKRGSKVSLYVWLLFLGLCLSGKSITAAVEKLAFDHNYTFAETAAYLKAVVAEHPRIARLHTIIRETDQRS